MKMLQGLCLKWTCQSYRWAADDKAAVIIEDNDEKVISESFGLTFSHNDGS